MPTPPDAARVQHVTESVEAEFRRFYDKRLRAALADHWLMMLVALPLMVAFVARCTTISIPTAVVIGSVPLTISLLIGLRAVHRTAPQHSAKFHIATTYLLVAVAVIVRVSADDPSCRLPFIVAAGILLNLVLIELPTRVLVAVTLIGFVALVGVDFLFVGITKTSLLAMIVVTGILISGLLCAADLERWTRVEWFHAGRISEATVVDALTGVANRRLFARVLDDRFKHGGPLSLLILDVDHFKAYNDHFGHPTGDECLCRIGEYLQQHVDPNDGLVARLGGEEFAVLMWSNRARAIDHAAALQRGIAALKIDAPPGGPRWVTASGGFATIDDVEDSATPTDMLCSADDAMYAAKRAGRDRLESYEKLHQRTPRTAALLTNHERVEAPDEELVATWRSLRFRNQKIEQAFRGSFERQALRSRGFLMVGFVVGAVAAIIVQGPVAPYTAAIVLSATTLCAVVAARSVRWSAVILIVTVGVVVVVLMVQRVVFATEPTLWPLCFPCAAILGMCRAWIRYSVVAGWAAAYTAAVYAADLLWTPPSDVRNVVLLTFIPLAVGTLRFAYRIERAQRLAWARAHHAEQLSRTDILTGLPNRRHFDEVLSAALTTSPNTALMYLDVDWFKRFNDGFGHPAGDHCLRLIGHCLAQATEQPGEFAARIGGEEFAVVMSDVTDAHARRRAAEIRADITALRIPAPAPAIFVTVSAGISHTREHPGATSTPELAKALRFAADHALYAAKRRGRDQLVTPDTIQTA